MTEKFRQALLAYLEKHNMSNQRASEVFDIQIDTLSKFVSGKTASIKLENFEKIARIIKFKLPRNFLE